MRARGEDIPYTRYLHPEPALKRRTTSSTPPSISFLYQYSIDTKSAAIRMSREMDSLIVRKCLGILFQMYLCTRIYLSMCILFNDAASISDYVAPNNSMIANNELAFTWRN
jgi:hypothetical protein